MAMYETKEVNFDGLIATLNPSPEAFSVTLRKGSAAASLKRGTLLDLSTGTGGDGKYVIHGTAAGSNETLTPNAVLCDDYEVGTTADVTAMAYRTGHFVEGKLAIASGASISAANKEALRSVGILLSDSVGM